MTTFTNPPARAIEYLGLVQVAPDQYSFKHASAWYITDTDNVGHLEAALVETDGIDPADRTFLVSARSDIFDVWYATADLIGTPLWWSPELQFAIQERHSIRQPWKEFARIEGARFATAEDAFADRAFDPDSDLCRVVTVDLHTGKEIAV